MCVYIHMYIYMYMCTYMHICKHICTQLISRLNHKLKRLMFIASDNTLVIKYNVTSRSEMVSGKGQHVLQCVLQ